ncbi:hypothetical protein IL252_02660 [Halomicrobium sp. IBSBa]|uniref:hypothetical protein n=1 Tax=unclassified Halomicrobium TaxID=2610901 RepID=UPI001ABF4719|nr:hypothetical protein [Halomicrobium sp. IBSBa]MBO4246717.1 hypothetical protein [Halomicrobium sp. IBSBa]
MTLSRSALYAGLDALPFAALGTLAVFVFGTAGGLSSEAVGGAAALAGAALLLGLGTISANRHQAEGKPFYFTRAVVVEGLLSVP